MAMKVSLSPSLSLSLSLPPLCLPSTVCPQLTCETTASKRVPSRASSREGGSRQGQSQQQLASMPVPVHTHPVNHAVGQGSAGAAGSTRARSSSRERAGVPVRTTEQGRAALDAFASDATVDPITGVVGTGSGAPSNQNSMLTLPAVRAAGSELPQQAPSTPVQQQQPGGPNSPPSPSAASSASTAALPEGSQLATTSYNLAAVSRDDLMHSPPMGHRGDGQAGAALRQGGTLSQFPASRDTQGQRPLTGDASQPSLNYSSYVSSPGGVDVAMLGGGVR